MTDTYGSIAAKIRELCARPIGVSQPEIVKALRGKCPSPFQRLKVLMDNEEVVRSGVYGEYRYFTDRSCAEVYDISSKAAQVARHDAARKRANAIKAKKDREKRKNAIKVVRPPKIARPPPKPKTRVDLFISKSDHVRTAKKEPTIVWPDSVKVQVYPTPAPRFAVDVPPGWKGQITRDWMDRILQDSCSL